MYEVLLFVGAVQTSINTSLLTSQSHAY